MKNIKVLAGSLAAITAGATLALGIFAAPATTLGDFVKVSGSALNSPVIVVGETINAGYNLDVIGAADIAAAVAGYATTTVSGGSAGLGVSGGVDVSTVNTKLYLDDPLNKAKSTITKADLSTLLSSGTITDQSGTVYNFDQYINLNSGTAATYTSNVGGTTTDPQFILNLSSTSTAPALNYTVVFNKPLNVSSTNIQNQKIHLLGTDYTIGATSTSTGTAGSDKIVLYGSSQSVTMAGGETQTVTVGGTPYTVKVLGASGDTTAVIVVNGLSQSITKGTSTTVSGLPVYVQDVFRLSTTDQTQNSIQLSFGTNKLTLQDGQAVQVGNTPDTITGTFVHLASSASGITLINIGIAAKDTNHNYATTGAPFVDPVFGAFKLALGGVIDGSTETITIDNSGTTGASLQFTDYRGNAASLLWAYTGSTTFAPSLNSTSTQTYLVAENQTAKLNDYVLFTPSQESDFSHILQYTTASSLGSTGAYIELKDVMSGSVSRMYLADAGFGTSANSYIDGQQFFIQNNSNTNQMLRFTWGTGSGLTAQGSLITVFPLVRTSKGGWVTLAPGNTTALSVPLTVNSTTTLELPGGNVVIGNFWNLKWVYDGVTNTSLGGAAATNTTVTPGKLAYQVSLSNTTNAAASTVAVVPMLANAQAQFPTVIFREEKGKDTSNTDVQEFVVTTVNAGSGSTAAMTIQSAPNMTAVTRETGTLQSDTSVTKYVDRYGTVVTYDSDSQGLVTITYPDEQSVATVAVGADPVFGAGSAGTVQAAVKITSPVAKIASEVSATAPGADLILVGGPCVNSLVKKLLGATSCDTWNYTTGIIKQVTDGFTDGSRALIVAGTNAPDTRALAAKVMQGTLVYAV